MRPFGAAVSSGSRESGGDDSELAEGSHVNSA
jgi:hypothetical protein